MSIATLKKKTASTYKNNSTNLPRFSLNGTHRNQGYIGQTSLSRTILQTPAHGTASQGHGGCCGEFKKGDVMTSSIYSTENLDYIKPSVISTYGMLAKRTMWVRRPQPFSTTKPSDSLNQSSSGDYIVYKRKTAIREASDATALKKCESSTMEIGSCLDFPNAPKPHCPWAKPIAPIVTTYSQGEYLLHLISECAVLDISYVSYNTNGGNPISTC